MTTDQRTPAERAYDATRLSYGPSADPTMGTDVTDETIAFFERLEAEHPEATITDLLAVDGPHKSLAGTPTFRGVSMSPGVQGNGAGVWLNTPPVLAIRDGVPTIALVDDEELAELMNDPELPTSFGPQRIHEVVRLERRGLAVIDAEHEVFVMTEAEYTQQASAWTMRVQAVRFVCDDDVDAEHHGKEIGTDYNCGKTFIYFPDDGDLPTLSVFGQSDYDLDLVARDLPDLVTLLNDPRVKAEMARYEATTRPQQNAA